MDNSQMITLFKHSADITLLTFVRRLIREVGMPMILQQLREMDDLEGMTYIHPTCAAAIFNVIVEQRIHLKVMENVMMKELMRCDYHEPGFVQELAKWLENKFYESDEVMHRLEKIFAVDGLKGFELEKNIDHLQYSLEDEPSNNIACIHTQAVRKLYDAGAILSQIHETMLDIQHGKESNLAKLYLQNVKGGQHFQEEIRKVIIEAQLEKQMRKMEDELSSPHDEKDLNLKKEIE